MSNDTTAPFAVSTWSLHRTLGRYYEDTPSGRLGTPRWGDGVASLLEIPALAAAHGIGALEICHFHFAATAPSYLEELKSALSDANVRLLTLLVDEGDITNPDKTRRESDHDLMRRWIDIASGCGAERVRLIAGDAVADADGVTLRLSASHLRELAAYADGRNVRVVTENWHALMEKPKDVLALLEMLDRKIGLMLDFGNYSGPDKYARLEQIAPYAESTHAKAHFTAPGQFDEDDFVRCLNICRATDFSGPHSLIFDGPGEEWESLDQMRAFVSSWRTAK